MVRIVLLSALLAFTACGGPQAEEPWVSYDVHGTVVQLQPSDQIVVLDHDAIGDWMGAMKMGFPVRDAAEYAKLTEGAEIKATLQTQGYETYYLESIQVLPGEPDDAEGSAPEADPAVEEPPADLPK